MERTVGASTPGRDRGQEKGILLSVTELDNAFWVTALIAQMMLSNDVSNLEDTRCHEIQCEKVYQTDRPLPADTRKDRLTTKVRVRSYTTT